MARRGRSRKDGRRTPNGRHSRAGTADPVNLYLLSQRLDAIDPIISNQMRTIASRREDKWSREERDIVALNAPRAKSPNLSYAAGIAFELGLFRFTDDRGESHDGRELLQAADIYAGLHRQVWGRLGDDIETAITDNYGRNGWELLLEVGRVNSPAPPASFFRRLVAGTPTPLDGSDPEEYQGRRLRLADRYGAARKVLEKIDLLALHIVEMVVIEGYKPGFLHFKQPLTAGALQDRAALVAGLKALAEHFGLFEQRAKDRARIRSHRVELHGELHVAGD